LFIEDLSQITLYGNLPLFADDSAFLCSEWNWDLLEERINADLISVGYLVDEEQIEVECFVV
jgi:hypothetical protein